MTAFSAPARDLADVVLRVARFAPTELNGRPPVCKGVLLTTVRRGGVEVLATDTGATGHGRVLATVTEPGRVLVDATHLARIARHLPAPHVRIATDGTTAVITCGPATWRLLTMPDEDYPADLPPAADLRAVRPIPMDGHQLALTRGEAFARRIRPRRAARPPRATGLYAPSGLDVGAQITWTRKTEDGPQTVTGQVWSAAPGTHAVWALAEGEPAPAYVRPEYAPRRGGRPDLTRLTECPPPPAAPMRGTP
ncbi:hypothetical protein [Actinomadura formosensis]|uniref:hypothetical protein n=1 Tax=Actinomadura formosensis TaxID=60706 RepID=UPI003D907479